MENYKGPTGVKNAVHNARNSLLPPKVPLHSIVPSYVEYAPYSGIGSKGTQKAREAYSHHQRTSSESLLIEEQPSWLDELLNEPETPVRKGVHRRSSSDSFTCVDVANIVNTDYMAQKESKFNNVTQVTSWGSPDIDHFRDVRCPSFLLDPNSVGEHKNWAWDTSVNSVVHPRGFPAPNNILQGHRAGLVLQKPDGVSFIASGGQDSAEYDLHDSKWSSEKNNSSQGISSSDTDTKRTKQQFAQRSRVRKLQYIADLERNVQALQVEGSEVSAQLEFINQQNLILSMENKTLKQRLENLTEEQLIKHLEHEVLEMEIERLRAVYQLQQQPREQHKQLKKFGHRRTSSNDLDQQLANLSLKPKDTYSRDRLTGQVHI